MIKKIFLKKDIKKTITLFINKNDEVIYDVTLAKPGSEIEIYLLVMGKNDDSQDLIIKIHHQAPDTKSRIIVKGILDDEASIEFNGLVKIDPGAKNSSTWLAGHFLTLSEDTTAKAIPNLEIAENDVAAGHAVTIGKINETDLFYLMSRGLNENLASKMIVEGFISDILNEFPKEEAKKIRLQLT